MAYVIAAPEMMTSAASARYRDAAQAVELIRALRPQLRAMTTELAWVERQDVTGKNDRVCALRRDIQRDIQEAQFLIDRLQRHYLSGNERTPQHPVCAATAATSSSDNRRRSTARSGM
jgi:hypothetical protein